MASSKWYLHKFYVKDPFIRQYLPDTALFSRDSLEQFLSRYEAVIVKPDTLHGGKDVIRISKVEHGYAFIRVQGKQVTVDSLDALYKNIISHALAKRYIVQQAIPLAVVDKRAFDIRSMLMRKPGAKWKFYGFFAKVAGPASVITNVCRSKGYVITIEKALRQSLNLSPAEIEAKKQELLELSHKICTKFNEYKASTTQIGIDFGLDQDGKIWIIEVNFDLPAHSGNSFKRLPDKSNYYQVQKMKKYLLRLREQKKNHTPLLGKLK
ncbi:MAG: YheC/YheD family protein [Gorillibacterium sp.]|nr:YheC/YheD family protein [Gorillibacterium sp.]